MALARHCDESHRASPKYPSGDAVVNEQGSLGHGVQHCSLQGWGEGIVQETDLFPDLIQKEERNTSSRSCKSLFAPDQGNLAVILARPYSIHHRHVSLKKTK